MSAEALHAHLETGLTTVCRCWRVTRGDGVSLGFTDHDADLEFDGDVFRAGTGMSAKALVQGTGMAVDNSEAVGALSADAISATDIEAGRYDGASVEAWLVNWQVPAQRLLRFRGSLGEIRKGGGAFHAELRGLTELLNQPQGRVYQPGCSAVLGDGACGVDIGPGGLGQAGVIALVTEGRAFQIEGLAPTPAPWFERGTLTLISGVGSGLGGVIKHDRIDASGNRTIELWEPITAAIAVGDALRLTPGCDKRAETCRVKFDNLSNFRGFPFIPGEDWLMAVPRPESGAE